jgi:hypothetical protein
MYETKLSDPTTSTERPAATLKRSLESIQDALKLAMAQMQFTQFVIDQYKRHFERLVNGGAPPINPRHELE